MFWLETRAGTEGRYCLLFSPSYPPRKKPDQFPAIEINSFNNDHVSNKFLHHNSPGTPHSDSAIDLHHNNLPQNLCSLMQLVAIWRRMCEHCYTVFVIRKAANLDASGLWKAKNKRKTNLYCWLLGLCPSDPFDEALADSLSDAALDLRERLIRIYYEEDAARKVMRASTNY